jgi:putative hydrolase of the HAD superfamily
VSPFQDASPAGAAKTAVVFDLFRTLVCPELVHPLAYQRVDRIADALSLEVAPLKRWFAETKVERNRQREPGLAERLRVYCTLVGAFPSEEAIRNALDAADRFHLEAVRSPTPEVLHTLRTLRERGVRVGVLSNTDEHEIRSWPGSPIARLIDAAGLSVDIGFVKPEPEAYQWILRALGDIAPHDAIFVGDGESRELIGAKHAGFREAVFMRGFVAHSGFQTPENLQRFATEADHTIDSVSEVLDLVLPTRGPRR